MQSATAYRPKPSYGDTSKYASGAPSELNNNTNLLEGMDGLVHDSKWSLSAKSGDHAQKLMQTASGSRCRDV